MLNSINCAPANFNCRLVRLKKLLRCKYFCANMQAQSVIISDQKFLLRRDSEHK